MTDKQALDADGQVLAAGDRVTGAGTWAVSEGVPGTNCDECDGCAREKCGVCDGSGLAEEASVSLRPCTRTLPLFAEASHG